MKEVNIIKKDGEITYSFGNLPSNVLVNIINENGKVNIIVNTKNLKKHKKDLEISLKDLLSLIYKLAVEYFEKNSDKKDFILEITQKEVYNYVSRVLLEIKKNLTTKKPEEIEAIFQISRKLIHQMSKKLIAEDRLRKTLVKKPY